MHSSTSVGKAVLLVLVQSVEGQTEEYEQRLREAKFCFAPYGVGWGIRLLQCILTGSVPVIVQVRSLL